MPAVIENVAAGNSAEVTRLLNEIADVWTDLKDIFDRMPERCDPYAYFERVRPYIHGWKDNPALPNGVMLRALRRMTGRRKVIADKRALNRLLCRAWTRCSAWDMQRTR